MREEIKNIIIDFQNEISGLSVYERDLQIPHDIGIYKAISIYGPRRAGKTYYLFSLIKKRLAEEKSAERIVYINFEDNRLTGLTSNELDVITNAFWELFPDKTPVFYLDEIQNINGWSKWVRRLVDQRFEVYITGSNSNLLSREIATELRGRTLSFLLLSLSFSEFLKLKGTELSSFTLYNTKLRQKILALLNEYLMKGGFPETIELRNLKTDFLLQDYIRSIIYKDIAERYNIRNTYLLKLLMNYCLQNYASVFSVHKFYNHLKSLQIKTGKDTLYEYMHYLEEALFIFQLPKESYSVINKEKELKKLYLCDLGYGRFFRHSDNTGSLFENLIFLELYRNYLNEIFYYKNGFECDFIVGQKDRFLVQACYNLKDNEPYNNAFKREITSTIKSMDYFGLNESYIVTFNEKDEIIENEKKIHIIPFIEFQQKILKK